MPTTFFIGQFYVDIQRNLIIAQQADSTKQEYTLPPKTIAVLNVLVKQQGEVISPQNIIEHVWPDTIVSPNSLQRCITQLRKVFVIDGDNQAVIKTHAKKGYCLEVPVRAVENNVSFSNPTRLSKVTKSNSINSTLSQKALFTSAAVVLFILAFVMYINHAEQQNHYLSNIKQLTYSDIKEQFPSYVPNSNYLVFHRYDGRCNNNIWAINNATKEEIQLTTSTDFYGPHRFSADGKKLIFLAKNTCDEKKANLIQKTCWKVMSLDFYAALSSPQSPIELANCRQGKLNYPTWIDNGSIAILRSNNNAWRIAKYMINASESVDIYAPQDKQLYYFDYMAEEKQFIVLAKDQNNQHWRQQVSLTGNLISSVKISIPDTFSDHRYIYPFSQSQQGKLFFATGKNIYTLHKNGKITLYKQLPFNSIQLHDIAESSTRLLASRGRLDNDVAQVDLLLTNDQHSTPININQIPTYFPSMFRSTAKEHSGKYQPFSDNVAFISDRSGESQIWLGQKSTAEQLTYFPVDSQLSHVQWHPKGTQLIVAKNRQLWIIDVDGTKREIAHTSPINQVYQWVDHNSILVSSFINGQSQVALFSLSSGKLTILSSKATRWAQYTAQDKLILLDEHGEFWQVQKEETTHISALQSQSARREFLLDEQKLYSINQQGQLWKYHLDNEKLTVITPNAKYLSALTDIKNNQLLATQIVTDKKDIVEIF